MKALTEFIKREAVFSIALVIAVVSMFFVKPDMEYIGYIDFRTIGLLFALMAVVAGFSKMGVIIKAAEIIIKKVNNTRLLVTVLWGICFFASMVITNDVALITFVPLSIAVLSMCNKKNLIIYTVVLQTVAANLGSMLTPMGNPQNLYIYNYFNVRIGEFFGITLPVIILSFVILVFSTFFVKKEKLDVSIRNSSVGGGRLKILAYCVLGAVSLMAVLKLIDYRIAVVVTAVYILTADRKVIWRIDWFLLMTFCFFFIFAGNVERIERVNNVIVELIKNREFAVSLFASQVISNVPAAVMLSGFTENYRGLILGTDIGGLGTLIASLASLISFKFYSLTEGAEKGKYVLIFSGVNVIFLVVLIGFAVVYY